jgi:Na+/H+-translocating membrane pyrophosphatase
LVALAIFGAYILVASHFSNTYPVDKLYLLLPIVLSSILIGSILPHAFLANLNTSVGKASERIVDEVNNQIEAIPDLKRGTRPDYDRATTLSTK